MDLDGVLVVAHSDKQDAAPTWKKTYGHHPLMRFVDRGPGGTGEPVAALLRPGNAGSNTTADHITATRLALVRAAAQCVGDADRVMVSVDQRALVAVDRRECSGHAFAPRRWRVERTLGWIMNARRNARDYPRLPQHSECMPEPAFYIHWLTQPGSRLAIAAPVPICRGDTVTMLGHDRPLTWTVSKGALVIDVPAAARKAGQHVWVFKVKWSS